MIRSIKNIQQYKEALERIYLLIQKKLPPESEHPDELGVLSILVKEYEQTQHPLPKPNRLKGKKFRPNEMILCETAYLLSTEENSKHLERSITQAKQGKVYTKFDTK